MVVGSEVVNAVGSLGIANFHVLLEAVAGVGLELLERDGEATDGLLVVLVLGVDLGDLNADGFVEVLAEGQVDFGVGVADLDHVDAKAADEDLAEDVTFIQGLGVDNIREGHEDLLGAHGGPAHHSHSKWCHHFL